MAENFSSLSGARLAVGFLIASVELVSDPLVDAAGRPALAMTHIVGRELRIHISSQLNEQERSVSLYHEILEAVTIAVLHPPEIVINFNEADFERAAYDARERFGPVTLAALNRMLHFHGFGEG